MQDTKGRIVPKRDIRKHESRGISSEARYISKKQDGNEDPVKAFYYLLKPEEETGMIEIGYIVDDSVLNGSADLYYCIGERGSQLGNPENRYIEVAK